MKIGYSTWGMPKVGIDEAVDRLNRIGFDGIEPTVMAGYSTELYSLTTSEKLRIRKLFDSYGLGLPAIAGHASVLSADAALHAENWRRLTATVDLCVEWAGSEGPAALDTTLGSGPESWNDINFVLERLGALVDYCTTREVVLAVEPHAGDGLDHPDSVAWLIETVDSPYCKLNFDTSHFDIHGFSTAETMSVLGRHSIHTHVKDQRGHIPNFEFLIPGEGPFDFVEYLEAMRQTGYDDYITAEVSMAVQRRPSYEPFAAAELCYHTLENAFRDAGIPR